MKYYLIIIISLALILLMSFNDKSEFSCQKTSVIDASWRGDCLKKEVKKGNDEVRRISASH